MPAKDYRETLARLGLSQARLGRLLELDKNTANRWAMGSVPVPKAVALLLLLMASGEVTIDELEAL